MGWVGLTHLFVLAITPALTEGCCHDIQPQRTSESVRHPPRHHYRVVLGEPFELKCVAAVSPGSDVRWSRFGAGSGVEDPVPVSTENLLKIPAVTADHSGNYSCGNESGALLDLQLQVLEGSRRACSELGPKQVTLTLGAGGGIDCPPSTCGDPDLNNSQVTWYKKGRSISELKKQKRKDVRCEGPRLTLITVSDKDSDVFYCDRHASGPGPLWITRRAVNVNVIPQDTEDPPTILDPNSNKTEEVVIGEPHTLRCKVTFGFERNISSKVQWYTNTAADQALKFLIGQQEQTREITTFSHTEVTQVAVLKVVTELHLQQVFSCLATNAKGTTNCTVRLRRRDAGHWLTGAVVPVVCVVLLTGLGVVLHLRTLELTLIYRSYWQSSDHVGEDSKDIDVFLFHAWSHASEDGTGTHTALLPSPSGEQGSPLSSEPLSYTPLEVLLRLTLEGSGYRLFLMERDLLPGGAYTEDVVRVIQRSRCLVCLLSGDFLSNSSAVFMLEAGIQALLRDHELKVMVIWTEPRPASMGQLDPPLPRLVHRALRVLPCLDWLPGLSPDSSRMFWKSFWKAMPKQNGASLTQSQPV
ncbi:interleukin-18 receptor accessory protein isoform X3 [Gadus morhua]|uniref:interleukin-18 receptor accessory protein isoform X3 n=1 Tax=Gadus morhua TaxID=8049 RepID=UPI0011B6E193|nr:interleukin-18 receptor accessory protein-like isoform X3 [Gadus morhua]